MIARVYADRIVLSRFAVDSGLSLGDDKGDAPAH